MTLTPKQIRTVRFPIPSVGADGYDAVEVDRFLGRVLGTLAGTDDLTAADIEDVTLTRVPPGTPAYAIPDVDDFLDRVAADFPALLPTPDLRAPTFPPPVPGRRAYAADEVDAYVTRVTEALDSDARVPTPRFGPMPPGGRGYKESPVDAYVDAVEDALNARSDVPAGT